jgi:multidrug efflux pump subunit AcrA (membrane-fusion protein)
VAGEQAEVIKQNKQEMRVQEDEARQEASKIALEAGQLERQKLAVAAELKKAEEPMIRANEVIKKLDKADITEMKGYRYVKNPGMRNTMAALMAYFDVSYSKKDKDSLLKVFQRELVGDINFLQRIVAYDKNNIKPAAVRVVGDLVRAKEWDVDSITKSSKAAGGLARWVEAIYDYHDRLQKVRPLQQTVAETEAAFAQKQVALAAKQRLKEEIEKRLVELEKTYEETIEYVDQLQRDKVLCEQRLENAGKLIDLLGEEGVRWEA